MRKKLSVRSLARADDNSKKSFMTGEIIPFIGREIKSYLKTAFCPNILFFVINCLTVFFLRGILFS